jgi:BASS family bile acid:Na+ symporter
MPMMAMVIKNLVMVSVILLMLGVGLGTSYKQIIDVLKQVKLVMIGILANFLVVPLLIYIVLVLLPLSSDIKIGIMLMAAAPIAPMAPPFVASAKGDVAYAVGLMAIVALLSVPLTPLILSLALPKSEVGVQINPFQIIKILITVQLIPIIVGMAIREKKSSLAEILLKYVPKIGQIGLLIGVGLLLAKQAQQILSIGLLAQLVLIALTIGSLYIGHFMLVGGKVEKRRALAVDTAIRNIPLAFLIANANFPGTIVAPVTLIFSVYTMIFSIIYGKMQKRQESQTEC